MATHTATVDQDLFDKIFQAPAAPTAQPAPAVVETTPPVEAAAEVVKPDLTAEQIQDQVFSATKVEDAPQVDAPATSTTKAVTAEAEDPETEVSEEEYTKQIFKAGARKLIQKGTWQDIEGFEDLDIDEDTFDELMQLQIEHRLSTGWDSIKQSSPLVNDILDILEQNGNPEQIAGLFQQKKALAEINTESVDGKKELIGKYYEEILKYPKAEITRRLKKLDLEGDEEIGAEFAIANQKYGEYFESERSRIKEQEAQRVQAEENAKRAKLEKSVEFLRAQKTPDSQIKAQLQAIYAPKWKMPSGEVISDLDYKLLEVRNNPEATLELAQFILDKDSYLKSKTVAATNQVVDEQFQKLKFKPRPTSTTSSSAPVGRPVKQPAAELLKPFLS